MAVEWIRLDTDEEPVASVVVLGWRDAPYLIDCLRSIRDAAPDVPFEVIVPLNEPTTALEARLRSEVAGIRVQASPVNRGYGGGCNRGAASARGEFLVFLNDDAVVEAGWLDALVGAARAHPETGAVGGVVLDPDGTLQSAGCVIWGDGTTWVVDELRLRRELGGRIPERVDYSSGALLLVRRGLFDDLGGFDDRYFPAYYEDADLCLRIAAAGRDVRLEPGARIRHRRSGSTHRWYRTYIAEGSHARFVERWRAELGRRPSPEDPRALTTAVQAAQARPPGDVLPPAPADPVSGPRSDEDCRRALAEIEAGFPAWAEQRLTEFESTIAAQSQEVARVRWKMRGIEERLDDELRALADVRARVADMEQSTSWRLTQPLRSVTSRARATDQPG